MEIPDFVIHGNKSYLPAGDHDLIFMFTKTFVSEET
jgi:hypothetical protein